MTEPQVLATESQVATKPDAGSQVIVLRAACRACGRLIDVRVDVDMTDAIPVRVSERTVRQCGWEQVAVRNEWFWLCPEHRSAFLALVGAEE